MNTEQRNDFDRYVKASDYPGTLDVPVVERELAAYLKALGIERKIVRLEAGWTLAEHPSLARYVDRVLEDFAKRNPKAARAAHDARDAHDARAARAGAVNATASGCAGDRARE